VNRSVSIVVVAVLLLGVPVPTVAGESDPEAVELARRVMASMGGQEAWDQTRFVSWRFFGGQRQHYWDRVTGDIRIEVTGEDETHLVLMNIHSRKGRVWKDGVELEGEALAEWLDSGRQAWVNDSYWMFMPYKLLDPGVTLKYVGEKAMADGQLATVVDLTFDAVGYTPENRYEVYVAKQSGLVEQWDFYAEATNAEPRFASPWAGWERFGKILLATGHGRRRDWNIAVHDSLDRAVFESPDSIAE